MIKNLPSKSLQTLLSKIIDYAGLYPPASLPLEDAICNFVKYKDEAEEWMLSRFVIPAKRLAELSQFAEQVFTRGSVLAFSILGRGKLRKMQLNDIVLRNKPSGDKSEGWCDHAFADTRC